jgi:hypothetical protein
MYTRHGHYIDPPIPGEIQPSMVARCGGVKACLQCTQEKLAAARLITSSLALGVLTSPTPPVPSSAAGSEPLAVPIDGLKDWYQRFLELKDAEAKIKDMLAEAREMLLAPIKSQPGLADTSKVNLVIDGKPVLQRHLVPQKRIDTKKLKAEDPGTAARYTVESVQERLNIV